MEGEEKGSTHGPGQASTNRSEARRQAGAAVINMTEGMSPRSIAVLLWLIQDE